MKNKLDLAHEHAMKMIDNKVFFESEQERVLSAWLYADLMQIESDKRSITGTPEAILKASNSKELNLKLITYDIDCYFDNANNTKRDADNLIQSIYELISGEVKNTDVIDWQPDFSKVPDWANFCVLVGDNTGIYRELYCEYEPEFRAEKNNWYSVIGRSTYGLQVCNSNINHADSLRKRP